MKNSANSKQACSYIRPSLSHPDSLFLGFSKATPLLIYDSHILQMAFRFMINDWP